MIQFVGVSKYYSKEITAVSNITFDIEPNEFVFLTGPSGSGKTTLIKMLIREEIPSAGKIFIEDEDVTRLGRGSIYKLRRKIGVIFQDFKLISDKNIYENVAFALEAGGKSDKEIREIVPYVLEIVGLSERMNSFPRQLSGGQQQKIAIARAIANDPKILIADEPTGNLDAESTWDIINILSKINKWGTTVLMATHSNEIINALKHRVLMMENGELINDTKQTKKEDKTDFEKLVVNTEEIKPEKAENSEKRKVKFGLSKKNKIKQTEKLKLIDESEDTETKKDKEENKTKSNSLSDNNLSKGTIKLLKANKYNTMQDLIDSGMDKIEMIDTITGDQIREIEQSINDFLN